jgi:hypothetical protein
MKLRTVGSLGVSVALAVPVLVGCLPAGAPAPPQGCWEPAHTNNLVECNSAVSFIAAWSNYHIQWPQVRVIEV